eukprot:11962878-Alexandrium_andersonii.AAC.1
MCTLCRDSICRSTPTLPAESKANDRWGGPVPAELAALTFADRKIMQRARTYVTLRRAMSGRLRPTR